MSASSPAQPYTQSTPQAHIIASDAEALAIAHEIAAVLKPGAAERDRTGIVPAEIVNTYSNSGLWGITVPRRFGGAEVSAATLAQVIAILSAADPSLGQIPQNHYCLLEDIRLQGSDDQQAFLMPGSPAQRWTIPWRSYATAPGRGSTPVWRRRATIR